MTRPIRFGTQYRSRIIRASRQAGTLARFLVRKKAPFGTRSSPRRNFLAEPPGGRPEDRFDGRGLRRAAVPSAVPCPRMLAINFWCPTLPTTGSTKPTSSARCGVDRAAGPLHTLTPPRHLLTCCTQEECKALEYAQNGFLRGLGANSIRGRAQPPSQY
jgi:hypothetical protein